MGIGLKRRLDVLMPKPLRHQQRCKTHLDEHRGRENAGDRERECASLLPPRCRFLAGSPRRLFYVPHHGVETVPVPGELGGNLLLLARVQVQIGFRNDILFLTQLVKMKFLRNFIKT